MEEVGKTTVADYRQMFVEESHLLKPEDFDHYLRLAKQTNQSLEPVLIEKAFISTSQFLQLSSNHYKLPTTNLAVSEVNVEALRFLDEKEATKLLAIPFDYDVKYMNAYHNVGRSLAMLQNLGVITTNDLKELRFYRAGGCNKCGQTGYNGRTGLYELLEISNDMRDHISQRTDTNTLKAVAVKSGMKTMFDDGLAKATLGIIDIKELLRVVYD